MLVLSSNKYCKCNAVKTFTELVLILVALDVNIVKVHTKCTIDSTIICLKYLIQPQINQQQLWKYYIKHR